MIRNPRDCAVSEYHFRVGLNDGFEGTFDEFLSLFMNGVSIYGPWWKHMDEYSANPHVHKLYYEDLHNVLYDFFNSVNHIDQF